MDDNINIEKDDLFAINDAKIQERISQLNKAQIFTIKEFINADLNKFGYNNDVLKELKAYQRVLKSKYYGETFLMEILLDSEYTDFEEISFNGKKIHKYNGYDNNLLELGFDRRYAFISRSIEPINNSKKMKLIDLIKKSVEKGESRRGDCLAKFYIDYYDNKMKHLSSYNIDELKTKRDELIKQRDELNLQIEKLTSDINSIVSNNQRIR